MTGRILALAVALTVLSACTDKRGPTSPGSNECTTLSLAVGDVATSISGNSVCLAGGASGAIYTLIPFLNSTTASARAAVTFTASGTVTSNAAGSMVAGPSPATPRVRNVQSAQARFESRLRGAERRALPPLMPAARQWFRARQHSPSALRATLPAPGDLIQLNSNGDDSNCDNPIYRTGRVVAVTDQAIVVADQGNPVGGYTDAEYQSLGVTFDTLVDPLDRLNFGDPTDIDGNKHILLFFTKTVNDLTPKGNDSFISGYFSARDLFPRQGTSLLDGCATSNVAEMFYLMVPDPTRGETFSKTNVTSIAIGTLTHEYQHLINAARRLYVNTAAQDFEEVWLNEGLSHVAEELLFYRQSGLTPRANIDAATLRAKGAFIDAFNNDQIANVDRYTSYLESPANYSPFADNDSLETRGATWSYLRYAVDHGTQPEQSVWRGLVNSTTSGLTNLGAVFGTNPLTTARGWATSVYTDDLVGAPVAYTQPSWNMRSIIGELEPNSTYPLRVFSLAAAVPVTASLTAGSAGYLTTTVSAGGTATVSWPTLPGNVQLSVVRVR